MRRLPPYIILATVYYCLAFDIAIAQDIYSFPTIQQLARQGDLAAPGILSLYYRYGWGVPQNLFTAADVLTEESANHPFSLYNMGVLTKNRANTIEDPKIQQALDNSSEIFFKKSIPGLQSLSSQGCPIAQTLLGGAYETGRGIQKNEIKAKQLYMEASKAGFPLAWCNLGALLVKEDPSSQDFNNGVRLLQKSADAGVPIAYFTLAQLIIADKIPNEPKTKAIEYLHIAADEHNHNLSQACLAEFYAEGQHVQKNSQLAQQYLEKAAQGNSERGVKRARSLGMKVEVSLLFPRAFLSAAQGSTSAVEISSPFVQSRATGLAQDQTRAIQKSPNNKPPPEYESFHNSFVQQAKTVFGDAHKALLSCYQENNLTQEAFYSKLPGSPKSPAEWLERSFANQNALINENPDWATWITPDKIFAFSSLDIPSKILNLMHNNSLSEALATFRNHTQNHKIISSQLRDAWRESFLELETELSKKIYHSYQLRQKVNEYIKNNKEQEALETLKQASQIDFLPSDPQQIKALQDIITEKAIKDIGL